MFREEISKSNLVGVVAVYDDRVLYHRVKSGKLSAASFFSASTFKKVFAFVNGYKDFMSFAFSGLVPENILKYNTETGDILFYTKPCYRQMIFDGIDIPTENYSLPYLLWEYSNHHLSVYALTGEPKTENDTLYQAPFLNVSGSGSVCMGNVKFKNTSGSFENFPEVLQDLFFSSEFTHTNCDKLAKGNIHDVYKLARSESFCWKKYLVKTSKTLKDAL